MSPCCFLVREALRGRLALCLLVSLLLNLAGCGTHALPPNWQLEAKGATERAVAAELEGHRRVADLEFDRARLALAATARADHLAQGELLRCAVQLASLALGPCAAFEALRPDASPAQKAYADYLAGRVQAAQVPLLPKVHQTIANQLLSAEAGDDQWLAVTGEAEPLTRLVAAGALFQAGKASPALVSMAVDMASAQGWRRPLLAWLGVQARLAELAGQTDAAQRVRRRMAMLPAMD